MFLKKENKPSQKHKKFSKRGSVNLRCLAENDFLPEGICTRRCSQCEYNPSRK